MSRDWRRKRVESKTGVNRLFPVPALMKATVIRLFVVLLAASGALRASTNAQTPGRAPDGNAGQANREGIPFDVRKIRKLLNEQPTGPKVIIVDRAPILMFHEEVYVKAPKPLPLTSLAEQLAALQPKPPWASVPQIMAVERAAAMVLARAQVAHPINAIQAARSAWYRHKVSKTRREVKAELEALKARQAAQAAESKTPKKPE